MSVATLLTQPKLVEKLQGVSDEDNLGQDMTELIRRILSDTEKSASVLSAVSDAFEQFARDFVDNATDLDGGLQQIYSLLTPLVQHIRSFGEDDKLGNFTDAVEFIAEKFIALTSAIADLGINDIRRVVEQLLTIFTSKFGFSLEHIVEQLWLMFDTIISELNTTPAGVDAEEKELRLITASLLGKVKRELQEKLVLPAITTDEIATAVMKVLREQGLDGWIQDANQIAEAVKAVFLAAGSIGELINIAGGGSVGAAKTAVAGDSYCWYASWLLATRRRCFGEIIGNYVILNPVDEVWISADKTQVIWRTVFGDDVVLLEGTNVRWQDAPYFSGETEAEYALCKHISHDTLEMFTQLTYALMEFGKGIWNSVDAGEAGDRATAITHAIWNVFNVGFAALGGKPFTSLLTQAAAWGQGHQGWLNMIFPIVGTVLPSLEGRHTAADQRKFAFWGILLADDVLERAAHHLLLGTVRDLLLSTFTLVNNIDEAQGNDTSHPINKEYTSTWAAVGGTAATIIFFKNMYNKSDYKYPCDGFLWSFAGALTGLCGGLVGTVTGSALAGFKFDVKNFFVDIGIESAKGFVLYYLNAYSWVENATDGGKFNGSNAEFAGYPEKTQAIPSPYKLPFAAAETKPCVQGNLGMWSHFASSNQIYAVDFGFDQGQEIVASRSGVVVDFFDQTPNDTEAGGDWNYIVVRHDEPGESTAMRDIHDQYHDGNTYITYGIYGHGRTNGVREIFAARTPSRAPTQIRGARVQQGEPIMKAGNTGISLHNHLHFQVKTKLEAHGTALPSNDTIPLNTIVSDTMPFVYQDVEGDGVVKSLAFYTSTNGTGS